ncbi:MAG TPA: TraR/DksA family transcriptional regulator [Syntrophales bacterium]|nr:TraR/DksA family transcriptional regulator [Syntrophales bacterium]
MKPEKLISIKKKLLRKLNDLQFRVGRTSFERRTSDDNPADIMDKASNEFDRSVELTIKERERLLLRELQGALMRIDRGVFGICEVCERQISEGRLLARPTSRLCFACMRKQERSPRNVRGGFHQANYEAV